MSSKLTTRSAHTSPHARSHITEAMSLHARRPGAASPPAADGDSERSTLIDVGSNGHSANGRNNNDSAFQLPLEVRRYTKGLLSYLPSDISTSMHKRWIRYPLYLSCLLLLLAAVGYLFFNLMDAGWFDPNVTSKTMVVYSMDDTPFTLVQGAFSDFQAAIGALCYAIDNKAAAVKLLYNNPLYVEEDRGDNYWLYFWESNVFVVDEQVYATNPPEIHFNSWLARFGKLGSFTREVIGSHRKKELPYPVAPFRPINYVHEIVTKHVKPQAFIQHDVDEFRRQHWPRDGYVVGVHYRGTDKVLAYPYKSPSFAIYDYYIQQANKQYNTEKKPLHIYIATDSVEFIQWAQLRWKDHLDMISYIVDSPRGSSKDAEAAAEGTHKINKFSKYQKGYTSVMDVLLLSKTQYIVKNRSGLSDVSIWFQDPSKGRWTMLIGEDDDVYHSANAVALGQPPEKPNLWRIDDDTYVRNPQQFG